MALNTLNCNHLMPLGYKGLISRPVFPKVLVFTCCIQDFTLIVVPVLDLQVFDVEIVGNQPGACVPYCQKLCVKEKYFKIFSEDGCG